MTWDIAWSVAEKEKKREGTKASVVAVLHKRKRDAINAQTFDDFLP